MSSNKIHTNWMMDSCEHSSTMKWAGEAGTDAMDGWLISLGHIVNIWTD